MSRVILISNLFCWTLLLFSVNLNAQGGYPVPREFGGSERSFEETETRQLDGIITYDALFGMINEFKEDQNSNSDLDKFRVAGFLFTPLWDYSAPPDPEFTTDGLRVTLVLWNTERASSGLPYEIVAYTWDNLDQVMHSTFSTPSADKIYLDLIEGGTDPDNFLVSAPYAPERFKDIQCSREFDFVFLDSLRVDYLARESRYFQGQTRAVQALSFERSFNAVRPFPGATTYCTDGLQNYRTLLFKPHPDPFVDVNPIQTGVTEEGEPIYANPIDYPSEAAITFRWGENCPPWWRPPGSFSAALASMVNETYLNILSAAAPEGETKKEDIWNLPFFQNFLIGLLILLALYLIFGIGKWRSAEWQSRTQGIVKILLFVGVGLLLPVLLIEDLSAWVVQQFGGKGNTETAPDPNQQIDPNDTLDLDGNPID